jgi:hypothetical protein
MLAKDDGDNLGHRGIRSKKRSSRDPSSRSAKSSFARESLPLFTTTVTRERGIQEEDAQIW